MYDEIDIFMWTWIASRPANVFHAVHVITSLCIRVNGTLSFAFITMFIKEQKHILTSDRKKKKVILRHACLLKESIEQRGRRFGETLTIK